MVRKVKIQRHTQEKGERETKIYDTPGMLYTHSALLKCDMNVADF